MYAIIYLIENKLNNKKYIGFTSSPTNYIKRKSHYKKAKEKRFIHNAIRKYGWNNFSMCQIYCSIEIEHTKNVMEAYFIKEYDTYNNGYNLTPGGDGLVGFKFNEKEIERRKGYAGKGNPFYGRHHSPKTKQILRNQRLGKRRDNKALTFLINNEKVLNLRQFCKLNNLNYSTFYKRIGNKKPYKGLIIDKCPM